MTKNSIWLCENAKNLEMYSGQWVMVSPSKGVVCNGPTLEAVLKAGRRIRVRSRPFVLHIPSQTDLATPKPVVR